MFVKRSAILLTALLACLCRSTTAQHEPGELRLQTIFDTRADFIYQDRNGFVWLGLSAHITRYDGATSQVYRHVPFDTTTISNGNYWALTSTSDGSIWLGTMTSGVNRMAGYGGRVERIGSDPDHPCGLTSRSVIRLLVDSKDRVWVGTRRGLNRFDQEQGCFVHYVHDPSDPTSLPGDVIGALAEDPEGNIWSGTNAGLGRINVETGSFDRFRTQHISQWEPVFQYDPRPPNVPYQHVRSIYFDTGGRMWIVLSQYSTGPPGYAQTPYGVLARFDPTEGSLEAYEFVEAGRSVGVSSILQDENGRYWAATRKGLAVFDPDDGTFTLATLWEEPTEPFGEIQITEMTIDRDGALWISWIGSGHGVGRIALRNPGIQAYSTLRRRGSERVATAWVDAVIASRDKKTIWFSAGNEELGPPTGLARLDRKTGRETRYQHDPADPTSLSDDYVLEIVERNDGKLWVSGPGGLNLLDPVTGTYEHFYIDGDRVANQPGPVVEDPGAGRQPNRIVAIAPVTDNELWLATWGQGAVHVDIETGAKQSYIVEPPTFERRGQTEDILVSRTGAVWIVVPEGAARLDPTTGESKLFTYDPNDPTSLGVTNGTSVHEDDQGRIWVGSFGGGLNRFQPETETWNHYGSGHGLPANDVSCITHDDLGYIWVSTFAGISRFDPETETFENFSAIDGVQGRRFAGDGCSRSAHGELFFGGEVGFNIVHPDIVGQRSEPPQIVLTAVGVAGELLRPGLDDRLPLPLSQTDAIHLDHDENSVVFEYAGIDFGHAGSRDFTYRLDPLETEWQPGGDRRSTSYANLDPGEYTFMARVLVAERTSPNTASIRIIIAPPWWDTWWAYLLFGCMVVGVLYAGYSYRVSRLKAYSERLEGEVAQRTQDLEEEKRKTEEQATRLLQLDQVKNRFFANISHEFRTPLTLIVGPLQDAMDGEFDDKPTELRRQQRVMLTNARRLLRLINQLLDLSKLESGKLELDMHPGDLATFLGRLTRSFAPMAERRGIALEFQTNVDTLPCLFDDDKIEKILSNLVANAVKFTPRGGKVGVDVRSRRGDDLTDVEIVVRDTGRGINKDNLEHVFDRFHQADTSTTREYEGTGIGLSLAKELTELHGGTISVESQVGFGSTFRVEISLRNVAADAVFEMPVSAPNTDEPAESAGAEAIGKIDIDAADGNGRHDVILIVDDNAEVRHYVKSRLASRFRVIEADDGEKGLAAAKEHRPDLILSDVMMPRMDGYEMVRRIRAIDHLRHVPIVLLTAKAGENEAIEGIEAGADDYIAKPFRPDELETRIASLIRKRREMREQFSEEVVVKGSDVVVTSEDAAFLEKVTTVVDERLDDANFGGDWLANEVGLSRRQLERKLDAILGESPAALIRRLRLERASQLLRARAGTVAEIAYAVGFTNPAYFARAFKKAYDVSPTEHMRANE